MRKKSIIIIIVIVILALVVIWRWQAGRTSIPAPTTGETTLEELLQEDTTSAAVEALDSLDLGDLDAEFEAIDAELDSL